MADRYATNAFNNFSQFEKGVFKAGEEQTILEGDNPAFIWPSNNRRIAAGGFLPKDKDGKEVKGTHNQVIQRGYMRMLSQGFSNSSALERRRLHFQFNPESVNRSVSARNDIQLWMNQDPVQLTQAIPGDANFSFELFFNREAEVNSGSYRAGRNGPVAASDVEASLALTDAVSKPVKDSDVTDLGVLADLMVFDEIIGQGINSQLIESIVANAKKINTTQRNNAAASSSNTPTSPATAEVTVTGGKITNIVLLTSGSGYVTAPTITFADDNGKGATAVAEFSNGKITKIKVTNKGSDYTINTKIVILGGGSGNGSSTKDGQDQVPAQFDASTATKAINANFGNSAFLVSLPVRIVFSSLFMVEGYITSTNVTFNKFNPNMVPTQCVVGITMQALYIGFAREKTYLTTTLDAALKQTVEDTTESETIDVIADTKGLTNIGANLFKDIGEYRGSGWNVPGFDVWKISNPSPTSKMSVETAFNSGTYQNGFGFRFKPTDAFKTELKKKTVTKISAKGTFVAKYIGPGPGTGHGTQPIGTTLSFTLKETNLNTGNLGTGADSQQLSMELGNSEEKLPTGKSFDTSATSQWTMELQITFNITSSKDTNIDASQIVSAKTKTPVAWDEVITFSDIDVMVPAGK